MHLQFYVSRERGSDCVPSTEVPLKTDHKKIIVTPARVGSKINYARKYKREFNQQAVALNEDGEYDVVERGNASYRNSFRSPKIPTQAWKHHSPYDKRSFSDHLTPLIRMLEKAARKGETWDAFYSRFCQYADSQSVLGHHIRQHLHNLFERVYKAKDGQVRVSGWGSKPGESSFRMFWIDPDTNVIKFCPGKTYRNLRRKPNELVRVHEKEVVFRGTGMFVFWNNQWYEGFGSHYDKSAKFLLDDWLKSNTTKKYDAFGTKLFLKTASRWHQFLHGTTCFNATAEGLYKVYGAYVIFHGKRVLSKHAIFSLGLDFHQFKEVPASKLDHSRYL